MMSQLQDRIAQFRKMASEDPDNELGHYRLGQLLLEDGQLAEAVQSFQRTLELSPQFSKVFQLLASCYLRLGDHARAVETLTKGFAVADERGDNMPRDEMARMMVELGEPAPVSRRGRPGATAEGGGFQCQRPGCMWGARARQLTAPPMNDELGRRIQANICAECWNEWLRNFSIKVINELRLDLSNERGQEEYDRYMREFLGLD
jgi:Fe-S cluster biosynthesis and repair protein YggX